MEKQKTICIIGGGPSGLSSARESIRFNLKPTIFEKQSSVGGLWSNNTGFTWDSMSTNITKFSCGFSDYPMPDNEEIYPNQERVAKFCDQFCKDFNLYQHINLNSKVIKIERINNNKQWKVNWIKINDQDIFNEEEKQEEEQDKEIDEELINSEIFDYLIISSGVFSKQNHIKKLEKELNDKFKGKVINSRYYKNSDQFKGKNVVIVGTSYSGCEIAAEISKVSNQCIQVGHRNYWVLSKYLPSSTDKNKTVPLDLLFFCRSRSIAGASMSVEDRFNKRNEFYKTLCPEQNLDNKADSIIGVQHKKDEPTFAIISSQYVGQVANDSIKVYSNNNFEISNILSDGKSIEFSNDKNEKFVEPNIDYIILCTGYRADLSFFKHDKELLNDIHFDGNDSLSPLILFKNVLPLSFNPDTGVPKYDNLAFISLYRGPFFSELELASRLAILTFTKHIKYPSIEKLNESLEKGQKLRSLPPNKRPQFPVIDFLLYCEEMAKEIGCLPDFEKLKDQDKQLYDIVWDGFFSPASYRLFGIGSNYQKSKEYLFKLNEIVKTLK